MADASFSERHCVVLLLLSALLLILQTIIGLSLGPNNLVFGTCAFGFLLLHAYALLWVLVYWLPVVMVQLAGNKIVGFLWFIVFSAAVAGCCLPVTFRDSLIHHLYIPRIWSETNSIAPLPWHSWSFYPQLLQVSYILPLQLGYDRIPSFISFSFLSLLSVTVFSFFGANRFAGWVSLLIIGHPVLFHNSVQPAPDIAVATYFTVGWCLLWRAPRNLWSMVVVGIFFGTVAVLKPNGAVIVVLALCSYLIYNRNLSLRSVVVVVLTTGLFSSPWLMRSYIHTGNPFFPLLTSVFGGPAGEGAYITGLSPLLHRQLVYGENIVQIVLLPLRIFFEGEWGNPARFDGVLPWFLILSLVPLHEFRKPPSPAPADNQFQLPFLRASYLLYVIYLVTVIVGARLRFRYLIPVLPLQSYLFLTVAFSLRNTSWRLVRTSAPLLLVVAGLSILTDIVRFSAEHTYIYVRDKLNSEKYLAEKLPEYSFITTVNRLLPHNSTVYLLYTQNSYYLFKPQVISGGHFSESLLYGWIKQSTSVDSLASVIEQKGITHLVLHYPRYQRAFLGALTNDQRAMWLNFARKHLSKTHSNGDLYLFSFNRSGV